MLLLFNCCCCLPVYPSVSRLLLPADFTHELKPRVNVCVQECEEDPCCEYQMCKLKSGAQCAYGECCYNCQYLPGGTVCRSGKDDVMAWTSGWARTSPTRAW
uniref:ADAM metallopeptidase domain 9a n=1 Tax=Kryptolebias marmoratus TaxID=37003 RepID=A0A3Q3H0Y3_KRYMA